METQGCLLGSAPYTRPLPLWEVELMETRVSKLLVCTLPYQPLPLWEVELMETLQSNYLLILQGTLLNRFPYGKWN